MDNLPPGAANDSAAPYNQKQKEVTHKFILELTTIVEYSSLDDLQDIITAEEIAIKNDLTELLEKHYINVEVK